jgi:hypothetical protein
MPVYELSLNPVMLAVIIPAAMAVGYLLKNAKARRSLQTIHKLEKEMLANHAEILRLQHELAKQDPAQPQATVVPMRENIDDSLPEKLSDTALLNKNILRRQAK